MRNRLLGSLEPHEVALLAPHLRRVTLGRGTPIATSTSPEAQVCFPETLVASFGEVHDGGERYETGMIGHEGFVGWALLLGAHHSPSSATVLLAGDALAMPAAALAELVKRHRDLHVALLRFVQSVTVQMSHTIVANLHGRIPGRLARWLLMLHDRIDGDDLPATHGELAAALAIRRSSVTDCLHIMEGDGVLRCTRGVVTIRRRRALEALAGAIYGPAECSYRALIGPFGKRCPDTY